MTVSVCPAKQMNQSQRKSIAFKTLHQDANLTVLAEENQVSRKFIYAQKDKATKGINDAYNPVENDPVVLFYLPVTKKWISLFIICLIFHCRSSYRGVIKMLKDAFDYSISIGAIHNLIQETSKAATSINDTEDLSNVRLAAHDELFHHNKPILSGVDIDSLYCHLLSYELKRDGDTWAINLWDLEKKGFNPERIISDGGDGLKAGHQLACSHIPCDLDNFHTSKELINMRGYFRNRLKSRITYRKSIEEKMLKAKLRKQGGKYSWKLLVAQKEEAESKYLSQSIDTLVSWMEHDVLNMAGQKLEVRYDLFDFIVDELQKLAKTHSHRIQDICDKLRNRKEQLLAYVSILDDKFNVIADQFECNLDLVWGMCNLQRYSILGDNYHLNSYALEQKLGDVFDPIEDGVLEAMNSTERTSSMVENLNSRLRPYLNSFENISKSYLELLKFYFNHTPFLRSDREHRVNRTPLEILNGEPHKHWLEMLGYTLYKRTA